MIYIMYTSESSKQYGHEVERNSHDEASPPPPLGV